MMAMTTMMMMTMVMMVIMMMLMLRMMMMVMMVMMMVMMIYLCNGDQNAVCEFLCGVQFLFRFSNVTSMHREDAYMHTCKDAYMTKIYIHANIHTRIYFKKIIACMYT